MEIEIEIDTKSNNVQSTYEIDNASREKFIKILSEDIETFEKTYMTKKFEAIEWKDFPLMR